MRGRCPGAWDRPSMPRACGADPYRVWLSEVMLQQTTTAHAAPYFRAFTERWPTVGDLAAAEDGEVMAAWAGLGYYARARNLLACARAVAAEHGGVFPDTEAGLRALPGVGAYTAAAVAAIAFDRAANVVDGNVERVIEPPVRRGDAPAGRQARAGDGWRGPWSAQRAAGRLGPGVDGPRRHGLHAQVAALPGLSADRRSAPPMRPARRRPIRARRPRRSGRTDRASPIVLRRGGEVALVRRPPKGLLGGMLGSATSEWTVGAADSRPRRSAPTGAKPARSSTSSPTFR